MTACKPTKLMYTRNEGEIPEEWPLWKRPTDEWLTDKRAKYTKGQQAILNIGWEYVPGQWIRFFSLHFPDGRIWDTVLGWREPHELTKQAYPPEPLPSPRKSATELFSAQQAVEARCDYCNTEFYVTQNWQALFCRKCGKTTRRRPDPSRPQSSGTASGNAG